MKFVMSHEQNPEYIYIDGQKIKAQDCIQQHQRVEEENQRTNEELHPLLAEFSEGKGAGGVVYNTPL